MAIGAWILGHQDDGLGYTLSYTEMIPFKLTEGQIIPAPVIGAQAAPPLLSSMPERGNSTHSTYAKPTAPHAEEARSHNQPQEDATAPIRKNTHIRMYQYATQYTPKQPAHATLPQPPILRSVKPSSLGMQRDIPLFRL